MHTSAKQEDRVMRASTAQLRAKAAINRQRLQHAINRRKAAQRKLQRDIDKLRRPRR